MQHLGCNHEVKVAEAVGTCCHQSGRLFQDEAAIHGVVEFLQVLCHSLCAGATEARCFKEEIAAQVLRCNAGIIHDGEAGDASKNKILQRLSARCACSRRSPALVAAHDCKASHCIPSRCPRLSTSTSRTCGEQADAGAFKGRLPVTSPDAELPIIALIVGWPGRLHIALPRCPAVRGLWGQDYLIS